MIKISPVRMFSPFWAFNILFTVRTDFLIEEQRFCCLSSCLSVASIAVYISILTIAEVLRLAHYWYPSPIWSVLAPHSQNSTILFPLFLLVLFLLSQHSCFNFISQDGAAIDLYSCFFPHLFYFSKSFIVDISKLPALLLDTQYIKHLPNDGKYGISVVINLQISFIQHFGFHLAPLWPTLSPKSSIIWNACCLS